ncbi:unnamed protein product [Pylaiella littoralis]
MNKIKGFVNEYIAIKDKKEALLSFDELPEEGPIPETVCKIILEGMAEGKQREKPARVELLRLLAGEKKLPEAALERVFGPAIEAVDENAIDDPNAEANLGVCLAVLISEKAMRFPIVMETALQHCKKRLPKIFTALLKEILSSAPSTKAARETLDTQAFRLPTLFPAKNDAIEYLEDNKLWVFQPGLWVSSVVEPKLPDMSGDISGFLDWIQRVMPEDVLKDGDFADQLTRSLLTRDSGAAPSTNTLEALGWACRVSANSRDACLWGAFQFFNVAPRSEQQLFGPRQQTESALARFFETMLEKKIVDKAGLSAWYQQYKGSKQDAGRSQLEAFFKDRVVV